MSIRGISRRCLCVDSYENGVPEGQIFLPGQPGERFESLSQLLLRGELLWMEGNARQSFRSIHCAVLP